MGEISRAPLNADSLIPRLRMAGFESVTVSEVTESTNDDAAARLRGTDRLTGLEVFLADEQTLGRGRLGRSWVAPPRSQVIASVAVQLSGVSPQQFVLLPLLAGVSIVEALGEAAPGLDIALKWPNDVLLSGFKLAGILVEAVDIEAGKAVIGFGLNYDLTPEELPVPHAASLLSAGEKLGENRGISREDVVVAVLLRVAENLQRFQSLGGAPVTVLGRYRQMSATIGEQVTADLRDRVVTGTAVDVSDRGELIVDTEQGRVVVTAGDVQHVRRPAVAGDKTPTEGWTSDAGVPDRPGERCGYA